MAEELTLLEKFCEHIHEDSMDNPMLSFYLSAATRYIQNATGAESEYLILLVASIMYEYRTSEAELEKALDAITPFLVQEAVANGQTNNE